MSLGRWKREMIVWIKGVGVRWMDLVTDGST